MQKKPNIGLVTLYLYVRMVLNPTLYGLPADALKTDHLLEERRADLVCFSLHLNLCLSVF